jgi:ABC-type uncharacterized transport system permease subunit
LFKLDLICKNRDIYRILTCHSVKAIYYFVVISDIQVCSLFWEFKLKIKSGKINITLLQKHVVSMGI